MNFLSKFLSRKPQDETTEEPAPGPGPEQQPAAPAPQEAPAPEPATAPEPDRPVAPPPGGTPEAPPLPDMPGMGYAGGGTGLPGDMYPDPAELQEFSASAGESLPEGTGVADDDDIVDALRTVYDPEIPVNIYDLGLIYGFRVDSVTGDVDIEMSLTAPGCPVAGEMPGMVARAVSAVEGTGQVNVKLVWEPMWTPERMSEDAKLALGMI